VTLLPATPLHFSAIAPLHFWRPQIFDITAFFYSSLSVDLELLFGLLTSNSLAHGIWHSYFFVLTIYPVFASLFVYVAESRLENTVSRIYRFFRFFPNKIRYSFKTIYLCCLIGGASHIFFDMWIHEYSPYILFPLVTQKNPFWIGQWSIIIDALVILLSLSAIFLWLRQALIHRKNPKEETGRE
jgi:hypothetical protein